MKPYVADLTVVSFLKRIYPDINLEKSMPELRAIYFKTIAQIGKSKIALQTVNVTKWQK